MACQRISKPGFSERPPIVWRNIEEVDSSVDGGMNRAFTIFGIEMAELIAERRTAEANDRNSQARRAKLSVLHRYASKSTRIFVNACGASHQARRASPASFIGTTREMVCSTGKLLRHNISMTTGNSFR